jgi:hypothetical protein
MWYIVAPGELVHDIVILLDDIALAVTPVGVAGIDSVVADAGGLDVADVPPLFAALIS